MPSYKDKNLKDLNHDETLVLSSFREVFQVNKWGIFFYKTMMNIVERTYRHTFHLQYKNQFVDSNN